MNKRKGTPVGILVFIASVILLDVAYLAYQGYVFLLNREYFTELLSFSIPTLVWWGDLVVVLLSLSIIPYGFLKRKQGGRLFAFVFLFYAVIRVGLYMFMTGEKTMGFLVFTVLVDLLMYLLMSSVTEYFRHLSTAILPSETETKTEYIYGLYTLYSKLVHLKNGKNQLIYFFSKKPPKSGTPTTLPQGYHVQVSDRSGLPYLKKDPEAFSVSS
ncbi:MAG: hypothetical protein WC525_05880 [Candidatus Thermoplasmatota archaeon]